MEWSKEMTKHKVRRSILFIVGLVILGFGARILLLSDLGTGGIDALAVGLSKIFKVSFGMAINFIGITLIVIGAFLKKKGIEWQPIATSILYGILFDLWGKIVFDRLTSPVSSSGRGFMFLVGLLIAPLGGALYILMGLSTSSVDYLMLAIKERFRISLQNSRIILEVLFVIGAWLVKGPIGIGTICIMLFFGPFLQVYISLLQPLLIKWSILDSRSKPIGIKIRKYRLKNK